MQQFNISREIKGWKILENHMFKYRHMIKEEAKRKVKILVFWQKYGTKATKEAFGVGQSTLYFWKQILDTNTHLLLSVGF